MTWSVAIHETSTGNFKANPIASAGTWKTSITSPGSGTHTFELSDRAFTRDQWRDLTQPWSRTLVHCWNNTPLYAGVIQSRKYSRTTATLTVDHSEIRTIFSRRLPFGVGDPLVLPFNPDGAFTVTNRTPAAAIRQIVQAGSTAPGFELPFTYNADAAGGFSQSWPWYTFPTIENMIAAVEKTDGGPDVHMMPQLVNGSLGWFLRAGAPQLGGPTFEWNVTAKKPSVVDVEVTEDGSKQLTGVFAIGAGSEKDIRVGGARNAVGPAIPFMDATRSFKAESDIGQLNAFASEALATNRDVTHQTGFNLLASQTPGIETMIPGSKLNLYFQNDYFMPDGWDLNYLTGMSGDMTDTVKLEVQPA